MEGFAMVGCETWSFTAAVMLVLQVLSTSGTTIKDGRDDYPNPWVEPGLCNRRSRSFVCNPDGVLTEDEAKRLDHLAYILRRSTICVCPTCSSKILGASFGVFIRYNVTNSSEVDAAAIAGQLRRSWELGSCEDDIIIVVIVQTRKAGFDIGAAVENVITRKVAQKIFDDCIVHFENSNFYQGLESMVSSFHDVLRRFQRPRQKPNRSKLSLILGASLGVIAVLLFVAAMLFLFKYRNMKKRKKRFRKFRQQESEKRKFEYELCNADETPRDLSGSGDEVDEMSKIDFSRIDSSRLTVPRVHDALAKRQLSDVAEENEEESDAGSRFASANSVHCGKVQTTEL